MTAREHLFDGRLRLRSERECDSVEARRLLGLGSHLGTCDTLLSIDLTLGELAIREGERLVILLSKEVLLVLELDFALVEIIPDELFEGVKCHLLRDLLCSNQHAGGSN